MFAEAIRFINRGKTRRMRLSDSATLSPVYQLIAEAAKARGVQSGLPEFTVEGFLPPGLYLTDVAGFIGRFGKGDRRKDLADGLVRLLKMLSRCGCRQVIVGGSFVTAKAKPGDFEGVWQAEGVDIQALKCLEPALLAETPDAPAKLDASHGGSLSPWYRDAFGGPGLLEYLQYDDRSGRRKGVVVIRL